jgi:hypothetical protein
MSIRTGVVAGLPAAAAFAFSLPASAAPLEAPLLTSPAFASPVTIHWTPAIPGPGLPGDGSGPGPGPGDKGKKPKKGKPGDEAAQSVQSVVRAPGACGAPAGSPLVIASYADTTTADFSDPVGDGTYCYWIAVATGRTVAVSLGLTVVVATAQSAGVTGAAVPAVSGAASAAVTAAANDSVAPPSPGKISLSFGRSTGRARVTIRWTNPAVADLARVELLLNQKRPPRSRLDGRVIYRGLAQTFEVSLPAGTTAHLALYAVDRSGNVSAASRSAFSLAALIPMRPLSGSSTHAAPLLRWQATKGAAYYNVQVFRRGKRVLVAWPRQASYRVPADKLSPGTYVWFVWPAMQGAAAAAPRFGALIGRATFAYVH